MSKEYEVNGTEGVQLRQLHERGSEDSTNTQDFDRLLSDNVSDAPSPDLPPVDGGRGAWMCLLGCWLLEAMIWGFAFSFGVFHQYYSSHALFGHSSSIATIGSLVTGVSYLGMPLGNWVAHEWPQHRRKMCAVGWLLCLVGLAAASLATTASQLVVFQGLFYGIGGFVCYTTSRFILNEWWIGRRGEAYRILSASSGVSGILVPFLLDWLLEKYGFRIALRIYGVITVVLSGPGLLLIQHRQPPNRPSEIREKVQIGGFEDFISLSGTPHFLLLTAAVFLQGLVFFVPNIFIPSFASVLGVSTRTGAGLLALLSTFQILGQLWQDWMSKRVNVCIPASISAFASAVAACFLWGLAKGVWWLVPFVLIWGFFSASYSVLHPCMASYLLNGDKRNVHADDRIKILLYSFFGFVRGVPNILEGPISGWLMAVNGREYDWERFGLRRYSSLIWFTGMCMLASSLIAISSFRRRPSKHPSG